MFSKLSKNSPVKNILVITLSNIGDVVMAAPVMDILLRDFPQAKLSVVVGERPVTLFEGNPRIERIHVFNKSMPKIKQAQWTLSLRQYGYDAVIDLRNTMIGYFLTPKWGARPSLGIDLTIHIKDQHLNRLRNLYEYDSAQAPALSIAPTSADEVYVDQLLKDLGSRPFAVIVPFAADLAKTWPSKEFSGLTKSIVESFGLPIVMLGADHQKEAIDQIIRDAGVPVLSLAGKTNLIQTAALIKRSKIIVSHDSGPMHLASYFNKPVIALFGPTDPKVSRPWSDLYQVVHRNGRCQRCLNPQASTVPHTCMSEITQKDVLEAFKDIYGKI